MSEDIEDEHGSDHAVRANRGPSQGLSRFDAVEWASAHEETLRAVLNHHKRTGGVDFVDAVEAVERAAHEIYCNIEEGRLVPDERGLVGLMRTTAARRYLDAHKHSEVKREHQTKLSMFQEDQRSKQSPNPQDALEQLERTRCAQEFVERMKNEICERDDDDALTLLELMEEHDGELKPRERASALGWDTAHERAVYRRIKRVGESLHVSRSDRRIA